MLQVFIYHYCTGINLSIQNITMLHTHGHIHIKICTYVYIKCSQNCLSVTVVFTFGKWAFLTHMKKIK